jgi:hypothetical protein
MNRFPCAFLSDHELLGENPGLREKSGGVGGGIDEGHCCQQN